MGQGPDIVLIVQDKVQSFRRVHDGSDAGDAGQLQQSVSDTRATATGQSLQCLHQQVQTPQLQELHHPRLITSLQPTPQAGVVHHRGNLQGTGRRQDGRRLETGSQRQEVRDRKSGTGSPSCSVNQGAALYLQQADAEFGVGVLQICLQLSVRVMGGTSCHAFLHCLPFCFGCHDDEKLQRRDGRFVLILK